MQPPKQRRVSAVNELGAHAIPTGGRARVATLGEAIVAMMRHPGQPEGFLGPFPSGAPCIFASAAARLGCSVALGAGIGRDEFGTLVTETLTAHGVDVRFVHSDPSAPTSAAFVTYREDGSRSFVFYLSSTAALEYPAELVPQLLSGAHWLHVSGSTLGFGGSMARAVEQALEIAKARSMRISVDPNVRAEASGPALATRLRATLALADVIFASEGELRAVDIDITRDVADGVVVCDKRGAAGAAVLFGGTWHEVRAPKVEQVDPDGAGDIFSGAFVAATLAGRDPIGATRIACRVAADSVRVHGPMSSTISALPELDATGQ